MNIGKPDLHDCLIFRRFGMLVSSAFAVCLLHGESHQVCGSEEGTAGNIAKLNQSEKI